MAYLGSKSVFSFYLEIHWQIINDLTETTLHEETQYLVYL